MPHLALGFGGILYVKLSCTSLKRELFFRNTDTSLHFPCHPNPLFFCDYHVVCGQSACFHSCHTLMSPRCNQQNINTGAWSLWPYMPQSLALYWKSLVLLQLATPQKRLPESSDLRLGSIPLSALFPALVPSLRLQWLLFALTGHLLSNPHEDRPLCREFWSLEWHW